MQPALVKRIILALSAIVIISNVGYLIVSMRNDESLREWLGINQLLLGLLLVLIGTTMHLRAQRMVGVFLIVAGAVGLFVGLKIIL